MKSNKVKKQILALILVLIVAGLAGVSFYVSSLLNTTKPVAPTAPRSKPKAAEWFGGASCNTTFTIAGPGLACVKTAHDTDASQSPIGTVAASKEIIYKVKVTNSGNGDLTNVLVDDVLDGENQSGLSYVSSSTGCSFDSTSRKVSCTIASLLKNETKEIAFRVKVQANAANGQVIKNLAVAKSGEISAECSSNVTVAGVTTTPTSTTVTATSTVTTTATAQPTATQSGGQATRRVIATASASATPVTLPESGVFNLPGAAAFGTGLLLTVLGILFAL